MKRSNRAAQRATLRKILVRLSRRGGRAALSLLLAAGIVALSLYVPVLTGHAVDRIAGAGRVDFASLAGTLLQIGVSIAGISALQWLLSAINNRIAFCTVRDLRREAFQRIERLPLKYLDGHAAGELISRVIADADQFAEGLLLGFSQLFTGALTILGTLGFMLYVHPVITLVVVLVTPVSLFVAAFVAKRTYEMFRMQSAARGEQTALIDEMIGGQNVVQAFGRERETLARFDAINDRLQRFSLRAIFFSSVTNPSTRFVNSLVYAGVAVSGALFAVTGGLSIGQLTMFLSYANQYTKPFNEISGVIAELQNALACAARLFELIEQPVEAPDAVDAQTLSDVRGALTMEKVCFSYDSSRKLIEDWNLAVEPGQRIAIVGPTGCGKTTIINLLMRFYDPDAGTIRLDGVPVRQVTRKSLRAAYGMVLQDTWIKGGTIRENIALGRPDAPLEQIVAAAQACHADGFIRRLPNGYDTVVSEDGGTLSEGQKQLLCIARVMLCHPPMLILDEATSAIDTRTELVVQEAFAKLMEGRTSFIVAHRLSTIRSADLILVMKDGRIIEQGRHANLLANGGFYATLYRSQYAGESQ